MFSSERNSFLIPLQCYLARVTSKIQLYWCFWGRGNESIVSIPTELLCFWCPWKENTDQFPVQAELGGTDMIMSYRFSLSLHHWCFRGRWINCLYSYWAPMLWWPRKSRSTSGSGGIRRYWWLCSIDFHNFFTIYVFEVKEFDAGISTELPYYSRFECPRKSIST